METVVMVTKLPKIPDLGRRLLLVLANPTRKEVNEAIEEIAAHVNQGYHARTVELSISRYAWSKPIYADFTDGYRDGRYYGDVNTTTGLLGVAWHDWNPFTSKPNDPRRFRVVAIDGDRVVAAKGSSDAYRHGPFGHRLLEARADYSADFAWMWTRRGIDYYLTALLDVVCAKHHVSARRDKPDLLRRVVRNALTVYAQTKKPHQSVIDVLRDVFVLKT